MGKVWGEAAARYRVSFRGADGVACWRDVSVRRAVPGFCANPAGPFIAHIVGTTRYLRGHTPEDAIAHASKVVRWDVVEIQRPADLPAP